MTHDEKVIPLPGDRVTYIKICSCGARGSVQTRKEDAERDKLDHFGKD